jgi:signal transduction histidine kinase
VLGNAVKFSPNGGQLEIAIRAEGVGTLVSVSDCGIGLPSGASETIFELFGRATNAQRSRVTGTSLGLYISRQIVEQHGGRIWAQSFGEGCGTTVSVWLPSTQRDQTDAPPCHMLAGEEGSSIRATPGAVLEVEGSCSA